MISQSTKVTACHRASMQSSGPKSLEPMMNYLGQLTIIAMTAAAAMRKMTSRFKTLQESDKMRRKLMRSRIKTKIKKKS